MRRWFCKQSEMDGSRMEYIAEKVSHFYALVQFLILLLLMVHCFSPLGSHVSSHTSRTRAMTDNGPCITIFLSDLLVFFVLVFNPFVAASLARSGKLRHNRVRGKLMMLIGKFIARYGQVAPSFA